jgi:hypothetical protein
MEKRQHLSLDWCISDKGGFTYLAIVAYIWQTERIAFGFRIDTRCFAAVFGNTVFLFMWRLGMLNSYLVSGMLAHRRRLMMRDIAIMKLLVLLFFCYKCIKLLFLEMLQTIIGDNLMTFTSLCLYEYHFKLLFR